MPIPSLQYSSDGTIESPLSAYQEPAEVQEMMAVAEIDLQTGDEILTRPFEEFNNMHDEVIPRLKASNIIEELSFEEKQSIIKVERH